MKNGFHITKPYPEVGIGGRPLKVNQLTDKELDELANFQPSLTYGKTKQAPPSEFVPAHLAFDKKVLRFYGYFKESVNESPSESYRVRFIQLLYFLEDDSISIIEPVQSNSGIPQGKLLNRHRIPKNDLGDCYNWRDLNLGLNLAIYGRVYRVTNCDKFTKDFLESEGIIVNTPEPEPEDPYLTERAKREAISTNKTNSSFDKRRQFLEQDRKVLRFYAVQDNREEMYGKYQKCIMHYYLADDTLEIIEVRTNNDGCDPFPLLLRRQKIAKQLKQTASTFPTISMEISAQEVKEYVLPKDFSVGHSINILGRQYLIYDCDTFTKEWYYHNFGTTDFTPIDVEIKYPELCKQEIPPYNGFGTLEDSLSSMRSFIPKPPKVDFFKRVDYATQMLRYEARLDDVRPDDAVRRFVITYRLADDSIIIYETATRNSGFRSGIFLKQTRINKPGATIDKPDYYGPADFLIGAKIEAFGNRFVITDVDDFVIKFVEKNSDQFSQELIQNLKSHLVNKKCQLENETLFKGSPTNISQFDGDLDKVVKQLRMQFRKFCLTDKSGLDQHFINYDKARHGYINIESLKDMCCKIQMPLDEDVLDIIVRAYGTNGYLSMGEFHKLFEWPHNPNCK